MSARRKEVRSESIIANRDMPDSTSTTILEPSLPENLSPAGILSPVTGQRRSVTILDVAAALGMHKSTVSLALSGRGNVSQSTRLKVMEVAREMGYEPNPLAQRLASGSRNSMVFVCSGGLDLGLATEKILLIQAELGKMALEVPIYTFPESSGEGTRSQADQIRSLCRQQPRALVCATHSLASGVFDELRHYRDRGGIVVCYDFPVPIDCDQVVFDRFENAYRGARHLIERGHKDIGFGLSYPSRWGAGDVTGIQGERLAGFARALKESGLPWREEWVFRHSTYELGGAEMAEHFLGMKARPTGLCIVNDYVSLAFMGELARNGVRVPEDVSIVGHDNQPVAAYCPTPLTSISHPAEEIAMAVVELLARRLDGDIGPARKMVLKGSLVERQSVGGFRK